MAATALIVFGRLCPSEDAKRTLYIFPIVLQEDMRLLPRPIYCPSKRHFFGDVRVQSGQCSVPRPKPIHLSVDRPFLESWTVLSNTADNTGKLLCDLALHLHSQTQLFGL